jgi:hypothetical protein
MSDQVLIDFYKAQQKFYTAKADLDRYLENDQEYIKLKRDLKLAKMEAEIMSQAVFEQAEKTFHQQLRMGFLERELTRDADQAPKIEVKHFEEP